MSKTCRRPALLPIRTVPPTPPPHRITIVLASILQQILQQQQQLIWKDHHLSRAFTKNNLEKPIQEVSLATFILRAINRCGRVPVLGNSRSWFVYSLRGCLFSLWDIAVIKTTTIAPAAAITIIMTTTKIMPIIMLPSTTTLLFWTLGGVDRGHCTYSGSPVCSLLDSLPVTAPSLAISKSETLP